MSARRSPSWLRAVECALLATALLLAPASGLAADTSPRKAPGLKKEALKPRVIRKKATVVPSGGPSGGPSAAGVPEAEGRGETAPPEPGRRRRRGSGASWEDGYSPGYSEPAGSERVDQSGGSLLRSGSPEAPVASEVDTEVTEAARHEPGQLLVLHSDMGEAIAFGKEENGRYRVRLRERLEATGLILTVLQVRGETAAIEALQDITGRYPDLNAALNHRYGLSAGGKTYGRGLVEWGNAGGSCGDGVRIGVLDTRVATDHEALAGTTLQVHSVLPSGAKPAPPDHGTAIAALLAGRADGDFPGLLPASSLHFAAAFRELDDGEIDATADRLAVGLDWLLGQKVDAVNLSFVGPSNPVFEALLGHAHARGVGLVAAVGNDGPDSPLAFPARLDFVLAVTAVDQAGQIYSEASRGAGIDFAAPGVDLWVPRPHRRGHYVSGTSYAVPFVVSALVRANGGNNMAGAREWLLARTHDLGPAGADDTYGQGLLQMAAEKPCR